MKSVLADALERIKQIYTRRISKNRKREGFINKGGETYV